MYRLRAICLDVSSSRDLSQCAAFMRFVSLYHIRAICFIILHSNDLFRYIAFERFILFVHEISVLYVGDVFLNIVPLFHHRSFEPISRVRVETLFVLWPPLCKKAFGRYHGAVVHGNTPCRCKEYYYTQLCCDITRGLA
jgi:hypothetical protein